MGDFIDGGSFEYPPVFVDYEANDDIATPTDEEVHQLSELPYSYGSSTDERQPDNGDGITG